MATSSNNRRSFLRKAAWGGLTLATLPGILQAANTHKIDKPALDPGATVLFQGDSITDAGRARDQYYPNQGRGMGFGYVHHLVTELRAKHYSLDLQCYNRGISGNKVYQLADRWEDDCLQLQPDLLSILIGVNDFWHKLNGAYDGTVEVYDRDLRALLTRTKDAFPDLGLVICQPFAVNGGTAIHAGWSDFPPYQEAAHAIARDFNAVWIPFQEVFDEALKMAPASYWCPDGVHPSLAGAQLMSKAWMEGVGKSFDL
jgi:lysophospholipase L1-like esterase